MKTIISFIAAVMTIAMVLTACGAEGTGPAAEPQAGAQEENQAGAQAETQEETGAVSVDVSSLKTFGDLFALKLPQKQPLSATQKHAISIMPLFVMNYSFCLELNFKQPIFRKALVPCIEYRSFRQ